MLQLSFVPVPFRIALSERVLTLLLVSAGVHLALGQFVRLSECVCPGSELKFECTVVGPVATIWRGTAFDCSGQVNRITLVHSRFGAGGAMGECNNGVIIGRSHRTEILMNGLNKYISQLIIHLPLSNLTNNTLEGKIVRCVHDRPNLGFMLIGNHTIAYTRDAPPPDNVHLAQVSRNVLTFQWDPVQPACPDTGYIVDTVNCGECPNTTLNTSVACILSDAVMSSNVCTLSVEAMVCGSNHGNKSNAVTANVTAPDRPAISRVLPYYSSLRKLIKIDIEVDYGTIERFNISDGIDGSITSYNFNISFSESRCTLPTTVPVNVSSCVDGVCKHTFASLASLPCYDHPSQATVRVFASNLLRDGLPSMVSLNTTNSLFFAEYDSLSHSFSCQFIGYYENKSCEVTYGALDPIHQTCHLDNETIHMNSSDNLLLDTLVVFIPSPAQAASKQFCFTAIGTTSMFAIAVEGTFTIGTSQNSNTTLVVVISIVCVIIMLLLVLLATLSTIIVWKKKQISGHHQTASQCYQNSSTQVESKQSITDQQIIYAEVGPNANRNNIFILTDDKVEYAELNRDLLNHVSSNPVETAINCPKAPEANVFESDDSLTLDNLLIQLRPQVAPVWYKFGLALGIPEEILNNCVGYPNEECIVEVLDHWLRNHKSKPTWRNVAKALKDVELCQLADGILNAYKTGKLPIQVDMEAVPLQLLDPELDNEAKQESPPPLPPK